jgi:hypothetical protein
MNAAAYEILKHNPFEQPDTIDRAGGKRGKAAVMELRGTVVDGANSLANIGGEYYRLDHEVAGYRVIRIENGSVTLGRGGTETVLTIHNNDE